MKNSFSTRLSTYILGITIVLFLILFSIYFKYSSEVLFNEVLEKQNTQVEELANNIDATLSKVELSLESALLSIYTKIDQGGDFTDIQQNILKYNKAIYATAIAFEPYVYKQKEHYFMQYTILNQDNTYLTKMIGDARNYDYHAMDWYLIPKLKNKAYWSEPYFDVNAGGIMMTTYTVPLYGKDGVFIGIATADVSLDWITKKIATFKPYENSYSFMLSKNGYYISHEDKEKLLNETFFTATYDMNNETITKIGQEMLSHKKGSKEFMVNNSLRYSFYAPIERTLWSVCTISFKSDIFQEINKLNRSFLIVVAFGLLLIFTLTILVIKRATRPLVLFAKSADQISKGDFNAPIPKIKNQDEMYRLYEAFVNMQSSLKSYISQLQKTTAARERIESELNIAAQIQMGMLPTVFPPNQNTPNIELCATLIPARQVGGDLYDFFADDDILYFTIGDVSGKGVPASLLMAVTSSLFRSMARHLKNPAEILKSMNNSILEKNDANMFITLFVGALNVNTGEFLYSNAGHNAPVLLRDGQANFMQVAPNLPLGVMPDIEFTFHQTSITPNELLFLYTDGLTEAENKNQELYSDKKLLQELSKLENNISPKLALEKVMDSVHNFVEENEQSDDLTILVLKLKPSKQNLTHGL